MQSTESATRTARCLNVAICQKAADGEAVEWYPGAGEYCPECGEALALNDDPAAPAAPIPLVREETKSAPSAPRGTASSSTSPASRGAPPSGSTPSSASGSAAGSSATVTATKRSAPAAAARNAPGAAASSATETKPSRSANGQTAAAPIPPAPPRITAANARAAHIARRARFIVPLRWFWVIAAALVASAAIVYAARPGATQRVSSDGLTVCPVSSAPQLAADLVRGYAAKSGNSASLVTLGNGETCDVRFSMTPETPDDVIAHDAIVAIVNPHNPVARISETELRLIFSGSVHDWSELGIPPGSIVPILPDAGTDEAKALESSLLFGFTVDRTVRRSPSSAAVARAVAAGDRVGRNAIGLVAFSQAGAAKVVPLTYLPAPSVVSIAAGRYPYTLAIAVRAASARAGAVAVDFLSYARSSDGAAIVVKDGLVPYRRAAGRAEFTSP